MPVLLTGCMWLMMRDFHKGMEVVEINIGGVHAVTEVADLPLGDADLAFVVHGYECKQLLNASINVLIKSSGRTILDQEVYLDDLTWPASGGHCRPIGYLSLDDENNARPLRFMINKRINPVEFSVHVTQPANVEKWISVWVVYNDRNPVDRMLKRRGIENR